MRLFVAAFQPADALVDQRQQIGHAVGDRRIGGDRALFASGGAERIRRCRGRRVLASGMISRSMSSSSGTGGRPRKMTSANSSSRISQKGRSSVSVSMTTASFGKGGGEFVMRIEDQHAQLRIRRDRLVQQQRHGRRLADAGRADDGEMLGEHRGDMDRRVDAFVLGQLADDGGRRPAGIVDAQQGRRSGCGGRWRRDRDTALMPVGEFLAAVLVDTDFADQFDLDAEGIVVAFAPSLAAGVHGIDEGDDAIVADADRNQPADRPEFRQIGAAAFRDGGDGCPRTAACNDAAEEAVPRLMAIAAILFACLPDRACKSLFSKGPTPCKSVTI